MKCPIKTPVKVIEENGIIVDAKDAMVLKALFRNNAKFELQMQQLHYTAKAINSHEKLIGLLKIAQCPNCDGSGAIPHQVSERRYVTRDMAFDAGNMALEGSLYSDDEWEAEQCQWCDEREQALSEAEKE